MWNFLKRRQPVVVAADTPAPIPEPVASASPPADEPPPPHPDGSGDGTPPPSPPPEQDDNADSPLSFNGISLSDITRGLQHAAAAANVVVAHQYTQLLDQFFDRQPDGVLTPKLMLLETSHGGQLQVPLVALVTPRGMAMEKMRIELAVRSDQVHPIDESHQFDSGSHRRGRFSISMAPRRTEGEGDQRERSLMDITIDFVALEPPEGLMRLIDEYTNSIVPLRPDPASPATAPAA